MKKIAMILYGNIRYDSRVKKEIETLRKNKFDVTLITSEFDYDDNKENYNFKIIVIKEKKFFNRRIPFINIFYFNLMSYLILLKGKYEFIHFNDINVVLFSKFLKKKSKLIFDLHELFPEAIESKFTKKIFNFIEKINIKYADEIIQVEINRLNYFQKKYNLERKKIHLMENFPLRLNFKNKDYFRKKYNIKNNKKIAIYTGVISKKREIDKIICSIKNIEEIELFCFGNFSSLEYKKEILSLIENNNLKERIHLENMVQYQELLELTNSADIAFIFYNNSNLNNYYCASNKLYEALNYGVKILTNNYPGIKSVAENLPNVYMVEKTTIEELEKGLKYLLNVNDFKETKFYWENQEDKFIKIYSK